MRVFKLENTDWTQLGNGIDGVGSDALSGWSVSLSGDGKILAVGAPSEIKND